MDSFLWSRYESWSKSVIKSGTSMSGDEVLYVGGSWLGLGGAGVGGGGEELSRVMVRSGTVVVSKMELSLGWSLAVSNPSLLSGVGRQMGDLGRVGVCGLVLAVRVRDTLFRVGGWVVLLTEECSGTTTVELTEQRGLLDLWRG